MKVGEGLRKVPLGEDLERYFLVGETLAEEEEQELVGFLKEHIDAFAWTTQEMPGIDHELICHHLNVDPQHKPVIQKKRRSTIQHTKAVVEEVNTLMEADAIREMYYPEWPSNTVVVKRRMGSGGCA